MTLEQLNKLEAAYASGILKIREDNTWVEYQSMSDMAEAIKLAKSELSGAKPSGTRLVSTSKGYSNG